MTALERVGIVGAGLIGTSIALALRRAGTEVLLADAQASRVDMAVDLGAGRRWDDRTWVQHTVLAVPPGVVGAVLAAEQGRERSDTFSDTASVQVRPQADVQRRAADPTGFCGSHPIAGRERGGPAAARPDLFDGAPWIVTPGPATRTAARERTAQVARLCGATVIEMTAAEHDAALGLVSHVPQLVASLLAARFAAAPEQAIRLAGQGLRDTTRIAASDPVLWGEVIAANRGPVREVLEAFAADLADLLAALDGRSRDAEISSDRATGGDAGTDGAQTDGGQTDGGQTDGDGEPDGGRIRSAVTSLVARGNAGRSRLPGKHGVRQSYQSVPVVVEDAPGRLARLLADAADAGVNVEDLVLEHARGRPRGVAELAVRPGDAPRLAEVLRARGWSVHLG